MILLVSCLVASRVIPNFIFWEQCNPYSVSLVSGRFEHHARDTGNRVKHVYLELTFSNVELTFKSGAFFHVWNLLTLRDKYRGPGYPFLSLPGFSLLWGPWDHHKLYLVLKCSRKISYQFMVYVGFLSSTFLLMCFS